MSVGGEGGGGGYADRKGVRAPRATILHFVERLRRELGARGYRDEVVVDQREHVREVVFGVCVSGCVSECRCRLVLCVSVCLSVSLCVSFLFVTCRAAISFRCASLCVYTSLCVSRCLPLSLFVSLCLSLSLCVPPCLTVAQSSLLPVSLCLSPNPCVGCSHTTIPAKSQFMYSNNVAHNTHRASEPENKTQLILNC